MKTIAKLASLGLFGLRSSRHGARRTTDISQLPMDAKRQATPNLIFGVDDSGSMDSEVLLATNDGALWWDAGTRTFWSASGVLQLQHQRRGRRKRRHHLATSTSTCSPTAPARATAPMRTRPTITSRSRPRRPMRSCAAPPTTPLYYNPTVTYKPWEPAYISGSTRTLPERRPVTSARSHPWFPTAGTPTTFDLTQTVNQTTTNWTFRMLPGMVIPGATITGIQGRRNGGANRT